MEGLREEALLPPLLGLSRRWQGGGQLPAGFRRLAVAVDASGVRGAGPPTSTSECSVSSVFPWANCSRGGDQSKPRSREDAKQREDEKSQEDEVSPVPYSAGDPPSACSESSVGRLFQGWGGTAPEVNPLFAPHFPHPAQRRVVVSPCLPRALAVANRGKCRLLCACAPRPTLHLACVPESTGSCTHRRSTCGATTLTAIVVDRSQRNRRPAQSGW